MAGKHKAPARGALAGIKEDMKRAAAGEYNPAPAGVGTAWSHNFLNQKPWHPLNFRNQAKVFEAEQAAAKAEKAKAESKAEFDAEQEYLRTLSYLSEADRKAYSDRQSVSFMYQKPPGLDAALSRDGMPPESRPGGVAAAAGPGPGSGQAAPRQSQLPARASDSDKKYIANMLGAVSALQEHEKWEVKHMHGGGQRSPPRGGADPGAANQQLLVDSDSGASGNEHARGSGGAAAAKAPPSKRKKLDKLEQAEAFLKAAGVDPDTLKQGLGNKHRKKDKRDKGKHKHKHKSRRKEPPVSRRSSSDLLHPALEDLDPATEFLYTPHTITALIIGVGLVVYFSGALSPPSLEPGDLQTAYVNVRHGIIAAALVYLGYAAIQGPATCMVRPHPAVWRVIHGMVIIYLLALVFLLFQTVDDARQMMRHLYPELGVDLSERAYGTDCRLWVPGRGVNWPIIRNTVFDEFVIAHTLGWWAKAVMIRNHVMLWTLSIGFELMELTFQHLLPNFNECWWDSWLLDVLICNWLGIWAGMRSVKWFGSREYNWTGLSQQRTLLGKAARTAAQFTPHSWDERDWRVFSSPARCLQCLVPIAVVLTMEVNAFFLKYILWLPPLNPLNTYRLTLLFLLALPATKEYYTFIENGESDYVNKLGPFAWLGTAVMLAETLVVLKFGRAGGTFARTFPLRIKAAWGIAGGVAAAVLAMWSLRDYRARRRVPACAKAA
ncbi:hypothetical protein WJX81_001944 [Elliptochloris bilobata]|uniref:CDP-diacylglycerol--serine O-phosphatidyltransferase n=1 Tax=Elliptochloris bilobata TaxID=381761 RepID=A0AAW1RWG7_9CHLO